MSSLLYHSMTQYAMSPLPYLEITQCAMSPLPYLEMTQCAMSPLLSLAGYMADILADMQVVLYIVSSRHLK